MTYSSINSSSFLVYAFEKLSFKKLDSHNGENKPEEETDEKYVENGGDSIHQGIHNNL